MVDSSYRFPLHHSIIGFTNQRANDFQQNMAKGIPCHIVKIGPETDMVTVAYDIKGQSWAMPQVKMPVAFSPYGRDALVVGDKGYASPGDYYNGGVSGLGGGTADFSPRGNLTTMVFHPMSKTTNEKRDNDQYVVTGGKNGVSIFQSMQPKQQSQQGAPQTPASAPQARVTRMIPGKGFKAALGAPRAVATPPAGTASAPPPTGQSGATAGTNMAKMQIDKNGVITHQSANGQMSLIVDQTGNRVAVNPSKAGIAYIGGDGKQGSYMPLITIYGPCINSWGRIG